MAIERVSSVLCILLSLASAQSQARGGILNAIPGEALGFAVVQNPTDASRNIDDLAKLVQAPAPDLLGLAKRMSGLAQGIDEHGDLAVVLTGVDPAPKGVALVPVANFADFFAALRVTEPATGVVEVQLASGPTLVGRKGDYAAMAAPTNRDALEQLLASTTNLAADASLAEWLAANKASFVLTSRGIKQLIPKLTSGIRSMQATFLAMPGDQGKTAADGMNMYLQLFTAAETEVDQFGVALRIDSSRTVDLVKRIQFTPDGAWAKWAADVKPAAENLLAGLPAGPFVMAMGGVVPPGMMEHLMKFSVKMMQNQPMYKLTPEQAETYAGLSLQAMSGVRSMQMLVGVAEPGAGIYSNTTVVMSVDDPQSYLAGYEKTLSAMREYAEEVKSPLIPVATVERVKLGATDALEVEMDMSHLNQLTPPGGPDPQKMMQAMLGTHGKMTIYIAPADEHAVVMSYTSLERLKSAIDFYKSKQPGLSGDAGVAKIAAALPPGSQAVAFVQLDGVANVIQQFIAMIPGARAAVPDFTKSPPIGWAAKVSPLGAEGHLVVTAETLRAIGETVAKVRGAAPGVSSPQP
jgi:hypothetical protein